ncbi:hypothetical protein [Halobacillus campisalis]|uniref:Uncharacterized protein n=1 Tax=Halobacillus campisalis TaxID=435909 RepID=A0ABW2K8I8_9BACI|nr:hypothetical protein [Halobacillus campisalis]
MFSQEVKQRIQRVLNQENEQVSDDYIGRLTKVEVMDLYLQDYGQCISPKEIRRVILDIFGVNLEGISALEKLRISLFSKGQWIAQNKKDLFVVYTGANDKDVKISPTAYFTKETGLIQVPNALNQRLKALGYHQLEDGSWFYAEPDGGSVSLAFKDQTIAAIGEVVMTTFKEI